VKKALLIIIIMLGIAGVAKSQQLPVYSQYLYNKFLINPAVAGSNGFTSVNLTIREQWTGYYGSPQTYSLSYQSRLYKKRYTLRETIFKRKIYRPKTSGKVGVGFNVFSDINGLVHRTGIMAAYSYHLWLSDDTQLSLGLAGTGYFYKIDQRLIIFEDPDEPFLNTDFRKGTFIPDFNFGVYVLNRNYSIGFSAQELMQGFAKIGSDAYKDLRIMRTYYLFGSYDFNLDGTSIIEPSLLVKMSAQLRPQADIGLTYVYDKKIWGGLAYRLSGGAIIANIGVTYEKFFFGYSYDYTMQAIQKATYGSHEFVVAIKFGEGDRKFRWLDRY
jgi:type IX secretion system PorP/SprF family membrane protein